MPARRAAAAKERLRRRRGGAAPALAEAPLADDALSRDSFEIGEPRGNTVPKSLHQLIERERRRLILADSALTCLHAALVRTEQHYGTDSSSADVALLARSLVREAIDRLDWVFVKPFSKPMKQ